MVVGFVGKSRCGCCVCGVDACGMGSLMLDAWCLMMLDA